MLRRAVLPFAPNQSNYPSGMPVAVRKDPPHANPASRAVANLPSSRFAGVPANVEPDRPMVGMQEIGARSGRCTAAGNWTDEETAIADAHDRKATREIVAASRIPPSGD